MIGNFLDQFWSLTFGGLSLGFIYILIALGYTLVYGVLRMINFANSEIFMVGTFATVIVIRDVFKFTQSSEYATGLRLWFILATALVISMLVSGLLSLVVELVAYRRLRRRNSGILAPLISAIGVSMVLAESVRIMTDSRPVAAPRAMDKTFIGQFFDAGIRLDNTIIVIAALALFIALTSFINRTRMGKAIRAVSMNPNAARLMGINIDGVISATFLVGGLMTGAAGFFYVLKYENTASNWIRTRNRSLHRGNSWRYWKYQGRILWRASFRTAGDIRIILPRHAVEGSNCLCGSSTCSLHQTKRDLW